MFLSFNMSSPQGVTSSMDAGEKSKETCVAEKPLEGMIGKHSVSFAAESSVLAVAFTRKNSSITEAVERTLLCRDMTVQKATSEVASVMPVDESYRERLQLPSELETIGEPKDLVLISERECDNEERRSFFDSIKNFYELRSSGNLKASKLKELKMHFKGLCAYAKNYPDDHIMANRLYQCMAYFSYALNDIEAALDYFAKAEEKSEGSINFSEKLFIMHLMIGMGGSGDSKVFRISAFHEELKKWVGADEAEDRKIEQLLEAEFGQDAPHIKVFRNGIKAICKYENANAEKFKMEFEQSIDELAKIKKGHPISIILKYSVPMLKFAWNLELMNQGNFGDAMENVWGSYFGISKDKILPERCMLPHLDEFLIAMRSRVIALHWREMAITKIEEGIAKGYPYSDQLLEYFKKS